MSIEQMKARLALLETLAMAQEHVKTLGDKPLKPLVRVRRVVGRLA